VGTTTDSVLDWLRTFPENGVLEAPARSWATVTPVRRGTIISLCPARHGYTFSGALRYHNTEVSLPECSGLTRVFIP
jgi:hypothetical protein